MKVLWNPGSYCYVCSDHFHCCDYATTERKMFLKRSTVPSIFQSGSKDVESSARSKRYAESYLHLSAHIPSHPPSTVVDEKVAQFRRRYHNALKREKRLRTTLSSVLAELKEVHLMNEALEEKMSSFKGKFSLTSDCYKSSIRKVGHENRSRSFEK